ncbi:MAG TPA: hypothetical protein VKF35_16085 [Hyphomicrobiaceae bacterium]|nr:hypothetical protein [Hyphomicrobiaceae bacterium]
MLIEVLLSWTTWRSTPFMREFAGRRQAARLQALDKQQSLPHNGGLIATVRA